MASPGSSSTVLRVDPDRSRTDAASRAAIASRAGFVLGVLTAVVGLVAVWFTWRVFVATFEGQRVDQAAMDGAQFGRTRLWQIAEPVLEVVSVPALGLVLVAAMSVAVIRRRWMLAVQIAVLVVGANVTTQLLKYVAFDYPRLGMPYAYQNSLPSGHTTAAASVAVAAIFVVPPRARPYVAVVGGAYAGLTGVSTLIGQWHRPSDVAAAFLVVLAWAGITTALAALGRRGEPRVRERAGRDEAAGQPRRFSTPTLVVVVAGYLVALVAGAGAATALVETRDAVSLEGRTELLTAYVGGALGVLATTGAVFATVLVLRVMARPRSTA